jgi:hypothetical protein
VWLLAPLPLPARLPAIAAGFLFSLNGNIEWVLALVAVYGLRWPALWLVALFTKVAPFVGFGWFVIRGEWRSVAWTAGFGVALVAISAVLLPGTWPTWLGMLGTLASQTEAANTLNPLLPPIPFVARALVAVVLVWWGARSNRPVVLPFVLALCQPDWQPWAFGFLAAVPRLLRPPVPVERDDLVSRTDASSQPGSLMLIHEPALTAAPRGAGSFDTDALPMPMPMPCVRTVAGDHHGVASE